ncbi:helix-turn-helix domain-containing protein [Paenibacillus thalictri]|uniref:Helix-turn-helix domain-containing protein n=1 Tax=Paenibacillus thalictri TaxID=2527873 RepID=A0A4Q9DLM1_9BACL|nr:helix-turn-helix domain-containing protein [Paenibacillus thalictri]TBL72420.1 helix-turn-helix domain-containing protein [Paenibacillus thalictri]
MKSSRFTYFKRLFLFCMLIGFIPVIALGYFSYAKSSQLLLDKAYRGDREFVEQTQLRIEQKLKMVDNAQVQLINSSLVIDAMEQELGREDYQSYDKLMQSLYRLQLYEYGLTDVYLVNFEKNWILSSGGKEPLRDSGLNAVFMEYADRGKPFFWSLLRSPLVNEAAPRLWNMASVKTIPINTVHPLGLLVAVLPSQEIGKMIPKDSESGDMFVLDDRYRIIAARNSEWIGQDLSGEPNMAAIRQAEAEAGQFQSDDDKYGITFRKSAYNGWTYISKTNISDITKESKAIGWVTLTICLIVLLLVLAASLVGTRRLYSPIRKLYELVPAPDMRGSSAKRDELYWIEKNVHTLMGKESRMREQAQNFFAHRLLQGATRAQEIAARLESGELSDWKRMRVLCIRIDTLEGTNYTERDRDLLMFAINNMAGEIVPRKIRLNPIVLGDFQATILGDHHEPAEDLKHEAREWAEQIQRSVDEYLHLKISAGISSPFPKWTDAPRGFEEAKEALSYSVRLGRQSVLFLEDIHLEVVDSPVTYPQQIVQELFDHIKLLEEERCFELLEEFLAFITRKAISQQEFQMLLIRLLADLMRFAQEQGGNLYDMVPQDNKSVAGEILALKSAREIASWLQSTIVRPLMIFIDQRREMVHTKISDQMLAIIHQEYDGPLTLESCAAKLNYHPEYISRVFRKETGFAFSDYLSRHRLQIAKQLLLETNMTITEISEKLLYNKPQNFIRYFRKLEGITPKQYRELSRTKKQDEPEVRQTAGENQ